MRSACRCDSDHTDSQAGCHGGRATINFVVDTGTQLELGLTYVPAGAPSSDFALIMPRSDHPVVLRTCDQVCVRDCQTLP